MSNNNIKRESTPEEQQMFDQVMSYRNTARNAPQAAPVPQALEVQAGGAARQAKSKKAAGKKPVAEKEWNYTHMPPDPDQRKKNGRVEGRNLITWNRPRMAEKLLLHMMYECSRHRVEIPWDHVAHRLHPGSTGGAVVQHLNRLRASLIAEGHLVPPICQKPGSRVYVDPQIRGYLRKFPESDDLTTTRAVRYDEPLEDRRFNIPDSWDTHRPAAPARFEEDEESSLLSSPPPPPSASTSAVGRGATARGRGKRTPSDRAHKRDSSPDPADLDSDGEYAPGPKPPRKQIRRNARPIRPRYSGSYNMDDGEFDEEVGGASQKAPKKRAQVQAETDWDDGILVVDDDDMLPADNSTVFTGMNRDLIQRTYDYQRGRMPGNPPHDGFSDNRHLQHPGAGVRDASRVQHGYAGHGHPSHGYASHGYTDFQAMPHGPVGPAPPAPPALGRPSASSTFCDEHGRHHYHDGPSYQPMTTNDRPIARETTPLFARGRGPADNGRAQVGERAVSSVDPNASTSEVGSSQQEDFT